MNLPELILPRLARTAALLAALTLAAGCSREPATSSAATVDAAPAAPPALAPLVIETVPVEFSTDAVPVAVSGLLARRAEAQLSFKTGGLIATIDVRDGDLVQQNQTLATLRLDEIDAQVAQARTAVEKTRRDAVRVAALHADRVATLENLQDARSAAELAEAALRAAEFNRLHAVITAPAAGRILRRLAEPDELAAPGRPILAFAGDAGGWLARVGVAEPDIVRLRLGDRAEISWQGGAPLPATVAQIAESTDPATRTVEVELRLTGEVPAGLRSGFVVDTRLFPPPVAARPAVPLAALVEGRGQLASVFVLAADGHSVRRHEVTVETIDGTRAYLRTPLPAGARVATTGAEFLSDGRAVVSAAAQP
ncbi:MAG: efflux RND transporter periplasmic adaptor subunit [Opitutae bacterium]|nr:efflux RND transporter periplasmic adaptor subunit [Opitutae bacterium]